MELRFVIPGEAVPWARAGGGKSTARFTPARQRSYEGQIKFFCHQAMQNNNIAMFSGPIQLTVCAYYVRPKSWSKKKLQGPSSVWKVSRPDLGNIVKIIEDALNTVAWHDDAQVVRVEAEKRYGDNPLVYVVITEIG